MNTNDVIEHIGRVEFYERYLQKALLYTEKLKSGEATEGANKGISLDSRQHLGTQIFRDRVLYLATLYDKYFPPNSSTL